MASTQIRGDSQIMDLTVDLGRLTGPFIDSGTGDWDITNGGGDATITGLSAPTGASDAATKSYVDGLINGVAWKAPARVHSSTNVDLTTGLNPADIVDGVLLLVGDLVLLTGQTSGVENGVWVVQAAGIALRDSHWAVSNTAANYSLFVSEGTDADSAFTVTNDSGSDVIGTDTLTLVKFASVVVQPTDVFDETPTVTNGSPTVTLANTNVLASTYRVYLNGMRQLEGGGNDFTIVIATGVITFTSSLKNTPGQLDSVIVDYRI